MLEQLQLNGVGINAMLCIITSSDFMQGHMIACFDILQPSKRCQKSYHMDNWLVAAKRS